ncbi:cation/multidrug efflux pump [Bermanella marisrubri]|uniref:Cation/multidrug efflux pump n=1 Tax=Bermanella marisrubri TaxID=207949 RepID=Q1MXK3_9GAMM|nr:hypothetical protein [Bermanella marisrubri]EAT10710.1 Cation/multidrug efflux pump [Oceanobacter sp. RED65] [Bermanella marisrubri]QIZ84235.1 cation/multidrug efflux pump [Bermanella marisrubri]
MELMVFSAVIASLALVIIGIVVKRLFKRGWFLPWLKGTFSFLFIFAAMLAVLFAVDMLTYKNSEKGEVIATLKFDEISSQEFEVEFVDANQTRTLLTLLGDQWQLDARLIALPWVSVLPSYKLERLSGRYLTLEQEQNAPRSVHSLGARAPLDTWDWIVKSPWLNIIQAKYGSAAFMPMADGAIYEVRLYPKGLQAQPVNATAKQAIESWQ